MESISLNVDAVNTHRERPEVGLITHSHAQQVDCTTNPLLLFEVERVDRQVGVTASPDSAGFSVIRQQPCF